MGLLIKIVLLPLIQPLLKAQRRNAIFWLICHLIPPVHERAAPLLYDCTPPHRATGDRPA